jgi:hypothetical protein
MSREDRKAMILRDHPDLSLSRQCRLLTISRSSFYYAPKGESPENLEHFRFILVHTHLRQSSFGILGY